MFKTYSRFLLVIVLVFFLGARLYDEYEVSLGIDPEDAGRYV